MSEVAAILSKPLCTLAFCWRLDRRDGVTLGLTSHDRPLRIGSLVYAATPGMVPSAIRQTGTLDASIMDVEGALSSASISAQDLAHGRWDGASVVLYLTEWAEPGTLWFELARGALGPVRQKNGAFVAALNGSKGLFDAAIVPVTSPTCRATLGDAHCRVDMATRRQIVRIDAVEGDQVLIAGFEGASFVDGRLRWLGGPRCGLWEGIIGAEPELLLLEEPPSAPIPAGTLALLQQGCDKRMASCSDRFGNAPNFRGEPYLPGNDLLTRYPGA